MKRIIALYVLATMVACAGVCVADEDKPVLKMGCFLLPPFQYEDSAAAKPKGATIKIDKGGW